MARPLPNFGVPEGRRNVVSGVSPIETAAVTGYWTVARDGTLFGFGDVEVNDPVRHSAPTVGITARPQGDGAWCFTAGGDVRPIGDAPDLGSMGDNSANSATALTPIVDLAPTPTGRGYWLASSDGGIFGFGDAGFWGSLPGDGSTVDHIVAMAATPDGEGYYLAGADGGVFAFGNARFHGSAMAAGTPKLAAPIVAMGLTPMADGYWLFCADGGVLGFGAAGFFGSASGISPSSIVDGTAAGFGYYLVSCTGDVFAFGEATYFGAPTLGATLTNTRPEIAGIAACIRSGW